MKIKGRSFDEPAIVEIPVAYGNEEVIFKAKAVLDYKQFEALVPEPKAPEVIRPGGERSLNVEDPKYKTALEDYGKKRTLYMIIKSLEATEDLEWDKVKLADPKTWEKVEEELEKAFTKFGAFQVVRGVLLANGLNQGLLDQSRRSFLPAAPASQ